MVIKLERDAGRLACATHMAVANSGGEWAGTGAFPARSVGLENHHGNGLTLCVPQQGTDPPPLKLHRCYREIKARSVAFTQLPPVTPPRCNNTSTTSDAVLHPNHCVVACNCAETALRSSSSSRKNPPPQRKRTSPRRKHRGRTGGFKIFNFRCCNPLSKQQTKQTTQIPKGRLDIPTALYFSFFYGNTSCRNC